MRRVLLLLLVLATGCRESSQADSHATVESACRQRVFEGAHFTVCSAKGGDIQLRSGFRSFAELQHALGPRAVNVAFAMNAGMFDDQGRPIGLMIEAGRQVHKINRNKGGGNFHLLPNGVFLVRQDGHAEVMTTERFAPSPTIRYATQSGPMLVIDGKLHSKFDADGESRLIRNGVGIAPDGTALFAISEDAVSFGKFARFYRDSLKSRNALFLDGSVSSLWDPANHRMDSHVEIGPIAVAFKAAASAPDPEARATP